LEEPWKVGDWKVGDWKVGDVLGVMLWTGATTMVSLDMDCGSSGSLVWVAVEIVEDGASSFILALVLVGGMNAWRLGPDDYARAQGNGCGSRFLLWVGPVLKRRLMRIGQRWWEDVRKLRCF
jgi:hypothetical protein